MARRWRTSMPRLSQGQLMSVGSSPLSLFGELRIWPLKTFENPSESNLSDRDIKRAKRFSCEFRSGLSHIWAGSKGGPSLSFDLFAICLGIWLRMRWCGRPGQMRSSQKMLMRPARNIRNQWLCVQREALVAWFCGAFVPRTGLVSRTTPLRTGRPQVRGFWWNCRLVDTFKSFNNIWSFSRAKWQAKPGSGAGSIFDSLRHSAGPLAFGILWPTGPKQGLCTSGWCKRWFAQFVVCQKVVCVKSGLCKSWFV